jgi:alanine racemase
MTRHQLARFAEVDRAVTAAGAPIAIRHAANSSGALWFPEARFDAVRTGIAIYGNGRWPAGAQPTQAMRLVTEIAQLRSIEIGDSVGYGALWRAARPSKVAVLPLGYADGLPRRASGHAEVAIRGRRAPLVGLISMDIAIADVTDIPGVAVGDAAVLLGRASDGASISAAEYAGWAGLSEYEVTCGMSKRVPRTETTSRPTSAAHRHRRRRRLQSQRPRSRQESRKSRCTRRRPRPRSRSCRSARRSASASARPARR